MRNIITRIKGFLYGFKPVPCRGCGYLTQRSIVLGNVCSMVCYKEDENNVGEVIVSIYENPELVKLKKR